MPLEIAVWDREYVRVTESSQHPHLNVTHTTAWRVERLYTINNHKAPGVEGTKLANKIKIHNSEIVYFILLIYIK